MSMKKVLAFVLVSLICISCLAEDVPDEVVKIVPGSVSYAERDGQFLLEFRVFVKEGFFAYEEKLKLHLANAELVQLQVTPVVRFFDKTFQQDKKGIKNQVNATAVLQLHPEFDLNLFEKGVLLELDFQACTPDYCLFPAKAFYQWQPKNHELPLFAKSLQPKWLRQGLWLSLLFVFAAGFLTSLTPCVYPMIPITLTVLGASKASGRREGFLKSLVYVVGIATTYASLGVIAASSGLMFGSLLSNIYFIVFLSAILFLAALSMFDVFAIQLPDKLAQHFLKPRFSSSYLALFATGLFSGLLVGPCVGPVLVGVLGFVARTGSIVYGFSMLFVFAIGMGTLILLLGTFSGLLQKLPRSGAWMLFIKKFLAVVFLALIVYFVAPLVTTKSLIELIFFMIALFSIILLIKDYFAQIKAFRLLSRALLYSMATFSIIFGMTSLSLSRERIDRLIGYNVETYGRTNWDLYTDEKLAIALEARQPVVIDFYADWCAACKELKSKTFSADEVSSHSSQIRWLFFDATHSSRKLEELKEKYKIVGLPTVLFFNREGTLRTDLTLSGYEGPKKFKERLTKLLSGEINEENFL